jgi:broad specificity phosphatase PhoE
MGVVLLVRHGQASFGADDYDVLSETGWTQSRLLGRYLADRGVRPDVVVHGDMRRHRDTASAMAEAAGWSAASTVDVGWDEFDHLGVVAAYPDLPGGELDRAGFQRVFEQATARWTAGEHDGDYPESWPVFVERVGAALDRACEAAGRGRTALVVSSGGPIAAACAGLVDPGDGDAASVARRWARLNTVCVNSGVTRLVVGSTGARMLTFNEHPHLEGDRLTYR